VRAAPGNTSQPKPASNRPGADDPPAPSS
jgi:hypothetical protein